MQTFFWQCAECNLETVGDFIPKDHPRHALTYTQQMRVRCDKLTWRPGAFLIVGDVDGVPVRKSLYDQ